MCEFICQMMSGDAGRWWNAWTAVGAVWSLIIVYFWFQELNSKANKLILNRFIDENIWTDVFEKIVFVKDYTTYGYSGTNQENNTLKTWDIKDVYITNSKSSRWNIKNEPTGIIDTSRYRFTTKNNSNSEITVKSECFENKILAIKDLTKYTNVNEKYWIFKNNL